MSTALQPGNYRPSSADRLWLLRAVEAETSDPTDRRHVAQALVNRFVMLAQRTPPPFTSLATFVRAYSQPINPRWMRGGDELEAALAKATPMTRRVLEQQAMRRARAAERDTFDPSTEDAVRRALELGPVDLPSPRATDFSAPHHSTPPHLERLTAHETGVNTFYAVKASKWPGYTVAGAHARGLGWLAAAMAALALWWGKRGKRGG